MEDSGNELAPEPINSEADELKLIQAARLEPGAFGEIYKLYVERVYKYLYSRVGNMAEAEDLTAQTFLAAFEAFGKFRQEGHFASWLFTIARNKAMDHYRQRKNTTILDEARDFAAETDPTNVLIRSEQTADLAKLIQALTEEERELLRLRFLAEMSFPEISRLLHRNEEAVKKSLYRLLARLHSQLEVSND